MRDGSTGPSSANLSATSWRIKVASLPVSKSAYVLEECLCERRMTATMGRRGVVSPAVTIVVPVNVFDSAFAATTLLSTPPPFLVFQVCRWPDAVEGPRALTSDAVIYIRLCHRLQFVGNPMRPVPRHRKQSRFSFAISPRFSKDRLVNCAQLGTRWLPGQTAHLTSVTAVE